jgi:predicted nucleic acid-binding protein
MAKVYLDSNIVISLIEGGSAEKSALVARLGELAGAEGCCVVTDLVRLECRVKPMAIGDAALLRDYDQYFASPDVAVAALTASTYDRATEIRARYRFAVADSLHLAAAIEAGCQVFVTGDTQLAGFPDIRIAPLRPT